jgi:hypothetical protein
MARPRRAGVLRRRRAPDRTSEELVYGEGSEVVQRRSLDGSAYRMVKVPHEPQALERRMRELGWAITVTASAQQPFYWGAGGRA